MATGSLQERKREVWRHSVCGSHSLFEISDKISVKGYQPQATDQFILQLETDLVVQCIENARGTAG